MTNEERIKDYLSKRIKRAREEKGLSQSELGEVIGKTKVSISDMERGKVGISAANLALIAKKLGKPLNYFFPWNAKIKVLEGELNTIETEIIDSFRKFENYELEYLIRDFIVGLSAYSRKGELRKMADTVTGIIRVATDKD